MHIEGGGLVDVNRKNFWRRARRPNRVITLVDDEHIKVDGQIVNTQTWLKDNEQFWLPQWELWRRCVAMSSRGDFHWADASDCVAYRYKGKYINFVEWKKECYIRPSYELLPSTRVIQFLWTVWNGHRRPLGLVHPKAISDQAEIPVTKEYIRQLYDSPFDMCCQPFVIAGLLLGVPI